MNSDNKPRRLKIILPIPQDLPLAFVKESMSSPRILEVADDDDEDAGDTSNPTICNMQLYTTIIPVTVLVLVACVLFSSALILIKESMLHERTSVHQPCPIEKMKISIPTSDSDSIKVLDMNRTLIPPPKLIISRNILSNYFNFKDVLVFTGIGKKELNELVKGRLLITSSGELILKGWIATRLIILEEPNHLGSIWNKTKEPVHLLHNENTTLVWRHSRGSLNLIRRYTREANAEEIQESKLVENLLSGPNNGFETFRNFPICILSDGLAMDSASLFLTLIRKNLNKVHVDRNVIQIGLEEFLEIIQTSYSANNGSEMEIKLQDALGIKDNQMTELMLVAVHERNQPDTDKGGEEHGNSNLNELLLEIISSHELKNVRFWVASSYHSSYCKMLEDRLNFFPYKLKPLRNDTQVEFLTSAWSQKGILDEEKLNTFAHSILNISGSEHDVLLKLSLLGDYSFLTFQSILIAEMYEDEASHYAQFRNCKPSLPNSIGGVHSITKLVEIWIDKKIETYRKTRISNYSKLDTMQILNMHTRLALELVFPKQFGELKESLGIVDIGEVLKVGILREPSSLGGVPKFIYPSVAEYFVARSVKEGLMGMNNWNGENLMEFFESIFGHPGPLPYFDIFEIPSDPKEDLKSARVLGYLINEMLAHSQVPSVSANFLRNFTELSSKFTEVRYIIARSCAFYDFSHLFKVFDGLNLFERNCSEGFDIKLIRVVAAKSSVELLNMTLVNFEKHHEFDIDMQAELLSLAAENGKFSILQFLIGEKRLDGIVTNLFGRTRLLIHDCVRNSNQNSEKIIDEKIKVIRMLVGINPKLLEQRDGTGSPPLLSQRVHVRLLRELVGTGANVLARDDVKNSVLHLSHKREHLSPGEYHSLMMSIPEARLRTLVNLIGYGSVTPLMTLIQKLDPLEETLEVLRELGANFNFVDEEGHHVLELAMKWGRNLETLRNLIKFGSDPYRVKPGKGETLLHVMAEMGLPNVVKFLVDEEGLDVNAEDNQGMTPLDYVIRSSKGEGYATGLTLIERGGKKFKSIVNSKGQSFLPVAAKHGNVESLQLLLHLGEDVNGRDDQQNSPLHLALQFHQNKKYFSVTKLLLDDNANPNSHNKNGESPMSIAFKNTDLDFETFLLLKSREDVIWTPELNVLAMNFTVQ